MSPCSSATTHGRDIRAGRSPTPTPALPVETRLAGRPTGEYGFNALALGAWGIPVGLVAGDDALAEEVADWLPWAERVVSRSRTGRTARRPSTPRSPATAIRAGSRRAVERARAGELELLTPKPPIVVEVDYERAVRADFAAIVPGVERQGDRGVRFQADDAITAYRGFLALNRLASAID